MGTMGDTHALKSPIMPQRARTDPTAVRFGAIIRRLRTARGWTLIDLGRFANMDRRYLSNLEYGLNMPTLVVILILARALGVPASAMIDEVEGKGVAAPPQG